MSYSGAAFVVGSAPCLYADIEQAHKIFPFAALMLVNGAATAVERAEHILCGHEELSEFFVRERRRVFPNAPSYEVHACTNLNRLAAAKQLFPSVTTWHPQEMGVGATSASKAAKILMLLGYGPIVLCGCPLDQPGYFTGEAKVPHHVACQRIGDHGNAKDMRGKEIIGGNGKPTPVQEMKIIKLYRERFKILAQTEFKNRVFSMSGFTRDQLGAPPEVS
jgi:hypothetical protein